MPAGGLQGSSSQGDQPTSEVAVTGTRVDPYFAYAFDSVLTSAMNAEYAVSWRNCAMIGDCQPYRVATPGQAAVQTLAVAGMVLSILMPPVAFGDGTLLGPAAGALSDINALGGTMNCVACAAQADLMLRGLPYGTASLAGPASILELGTNWTAVSGEMEVGSVLSQAGNGSTGIVFGESLTGDVGHVWNAVNNGGVINFIDAQAGGGGLANFSSFQNFRFLLTGPGP